MGNWILSIGKGKKVVLVAQLLLPYVVQATNIAMCVSIICFDNEKKLEKDLDSGIFLVLCRHPSVFEQCHHSEIELAMGTAAHTTKKVYRAQCFCLCTLILNEEIYK